MPLPLARPPRGLACAQVLNAILASLSHPEDEIREAARGADAALRVLLQQSQDAQFEMHTLLHTLHSHLASQCTPPSLRRHPLLSRDLFLRHHHLHHHRLLYRMLLRIVRLPCLPMPPGTWPRYSPHCSGSTCCCRSRGPV